MSLRGREREVEEGLEGVMFDSLSERLDLGSGL